MFEIWFVVKWPQKGLIRRKTNKQTNNQPTNQPTNETNKQTNSKFKISFILPFFFSFFLLFLSKDIFNSWLFFLSTFKPNYSTTLFRKNVRMIKEGLSVFWILSTHGFDRSILRPTSGVLFFWKESFKVSSLLSTQGFGRTILQLSPSVVSVRKDRTFLSV